MRRRILISNVIVLLTFLISKPANWSLFTAGLVIAIVGEGIRMSASSIIVKSNELTTRGVYSAVRHPLYLGTFIIMLGFLISLINLNALYQTLLSFFIALSGFAIIYFKQIKAEEKFLRKVYGNQFEEYKQSVNALFPSMQSLNKLFSSADWSMKTFKKNKEYRGLVGTFFVFFAVWLRIYYEI